MAGVGQGPGERRRTMGWGGDTELLIRAAAGVGFSKEMPSLRGGTGPWGVAKEDTLGKR